MNGRGRQQHTCRTLNHGLARRQPRPARCLPAIGRDATGCAARRRGLDTQPRPGRIRSPAPRLVLLRQRQRPAVLTGTPAPGSNGRCRLTITATSPSGTTTRLVRLLVTPQKRQEEKTASRKDKRSQASPPGSPPALSADPRRHRRADQPNRCRLAGDRTSRASRPERRVGACSPPGSPSLTVIQREGSQRLLRGRSHSPGARCVGI